MKRLISNLKNKNCKNFYFNFYNFLFRQLNLYSIILYFNICNYNCQFVQFDFLLINILVKS